MSLSNRIAFVDDADTPIGVAIVKALEARGAEQEQAIRHVLTMLIEWLESETPRRAA